MAQIRAQDGDIDETSLPEPYGPGPSRVRREPRGVSQPRQADRSQRKGDPERRIVVAKDLRVDPDPGHLRHRDRPKWNAAHAPAHPRHDCKAGSTHIDLHIDDVMVP